MWVVVEFRSVTTSTGPYVMVHQVVGPFKELEYAEDYIHRARIRDAHIYNIQLVSSRWPTKLVVPEED